MRIGLAAAGAGLVAAAAFLVHGRPGAAFGLFLRHAAILIALLDMLGLALLLVSVTALVAAGHGILHFLAPHTHQAPRTTAKCRIGCAFSGTSCAFHIAASASASAASRFSR